MGFHGGHFTNKREREERNHNIAIPKLGHTASTAIHLRIFEWHNTRIMKRKFTLGFYSAVRVTRSSVLYVCFVDRCLSFCLFSFGHCDVCSSIYGF